MGSQETQELWASSVNRVREIVRYRMFGDADLLEEAVSETLLRVGKLVEEWDPERASFDTCLEWVARGAISDVLRRRDRFYSLPLDRRPAWFGNDVFDGWDEVRFGELLGLVTDNRVREVLGLYYRDGYKLREIAVKMGISAQTVMNLRNTGLRELHSILGE